MRRARPILRHAILARRDAPDEEAAPEDFELSPPRLVAPSGLPERLLGYCVDVARQRVLFTRHSPADLQAVFDAPFMFLDQLRTAGSVVSVPFERLAAFPSAASAPPVFIFSPGRVGSTLLARVLRAAGLNCASEPDMLSQVARLPADALLLLPAGFRAALAGTCVAAIGRAMGAAPFIKLRSQCNLRPMALVEGAPGCRVVFMLRGMAPWAMSRHLVFQESPELVAQHLREAFDAFETLSRNGVAMQVLWFETLAADPAAGVRICAPEAPVDASRLATVMATDSQAGTMVARQRVAGRAAEHGFAPAFVRAWEHARVGAVWSEATEQVLARMWRDWPPGRGDSRAQ